MKQSEQENQATAASAVAHPQTTLVLADAGGPLQSQQQTPTPRIPLSSSSSHSNCDNQPSVNMVESPAERVCRKKAAARELIRLIRAGNISDLQDMLRSSKPDDLNVMDQHGQTALHHCLLLGRDISWLKQLVAKGANPNLSTRDGWHPLHLAAFRKNQEVLTFLITCNTRS